MAATTNTAAWLVAEKADPLEVKEAPYTLPSNGEILIKNAAIGLNIVDWALQKMGSALFSWITYPAILGSDVAGEVVAVGSDVTNIKVGDRVLGFAVGIATNRPQDSAFQQYTLVLSHMASKIPDFVSFESASALPLPVGTAACGLFQEHMLNLALPTVPPRPSSGETVLIWGGSSAVGSSAIQLAVAAGYEVISTASPKNFEYVKAHGAAQVFDYKSPDVISDLVAAFQGKKSAGALAIGVDTAAPCIEIVSKIGGRQFVASANPPPKNISEGVEVKFIFGTDLKDNAVGPAIFVDFLPKALQQGVFRCSPPVEVAGHGLGSIQDALEMLAKGVSAKKLVVTL